MPIYEITDPKTNKTLEFEGPVPPPIGIINQAFAKAGGEVELPQKLTSRNPASELSPEQRAFNEANPPVTYNNERDVPEWGRKHPTAYGVAGATYETLKPIVELGGLVGGGYIGGLSGGPVGAVGGAGLGYGAAKEITGMAGKLLGENPSEETPLAKTLVPYSEKLPTPARNVIEGGLQEVTGQIIGKGTGKSLEYAGKLAKNIIGKLTRAGSGMVEGALEGTPGFKAAMRGKISGEEVVDNAKGALQILKNNRQTAYQSKLAEVATKQGDLDIAPIRDTFFDLSKKYNIKINPDGTGVDVSRIAMGKTGRNDIKDIIKTMVEWGKQPGDMNATGLDTLKRQLDDFYSDSSQARGFVSSLRKSVNDTIAKQVPAYGEMTKGYAEATKLIKDIESNLMLRKSGMHGRLTADNSLRRLTSAMRDNFEMRKDLVLALSEGADKDIMGQISGYTASPLLPTGAGGAAEIGVESYIVYMNPKLWPLLAASSPRLSGEFLNIYGQGLRQLKRIDPKLYGVAIKGGIQAATQNNGKEEGGSPVEAPIPKPEPVMTPPVTPEPPKVEEPKKVVAELEPQKKKHVKKGKWNKKTKKVEMEE